MTEEPTNRELMQSLEELKDRFVDLKNEDVKEIKVQTRLTNGRVGALEKWQSFMIGGMTIISVIVFPVCFMVAKQAFDDSRPKSIEDLTKDTIDIRAALDKIEATQ